MPAWGVNAAALGAVLLAVAIFCLALLWQVGSWHIPRLAQLMFDEGLQVGSAAPEIAAHTLNGQDAHLTFGGTLSLVVFGASGCRPCEELLAAAGSHPATRHMRRVYLTNDVSTDVARDAIERWEVYAFHNEDRARQQWRAPVSPYFHLIDERGLILGKGVANKPEHLDRLFAVQPRSLRGAEPEVAGL